MAKQKKKAPAEAEAVTIIAGALVIGASAQATANSLAPLLGIPAPDLLTVLLLAMSKPIPHGKVPTLSSATASAENAATEYTYRAQYVYAASKRLSTATDRDAAVERERTYFAQHMEAMENRRTTAAQVDKARSRHGDELGWYAKMDSRTSAECREANGKNFSASRMPTIGYPGAVHPHCRCRAGKKHATSQTVYSVEPRDYKAA